MRSVEVSAADLLGLVSGELAHVTVNEETHEPRSYPTSILLEPIRLPKEAVRIVLRKADPLDRLIAAVARGAITALSSEMYGREISALKPGSKR